MKKTLLINSAVAALIVLILSLFGQFYLQPESICGIIFVFMCLYNALIFNVCHKSGSGCLLLFLSFNWVVALFELLADKKAKEDLYATLRNLMLEIIPYQLIVIFCFRGGFKIGFGYLIFLAATCIGYGIYALKRKKKLDESRKAEEAELKAQEMREELGKFR